MFNSPEAAAGPVSWTYYKTVNRYVKMWCLQAPHCWTSKSLSIPNDRARGRFSHPIAWLAPAGWPPRTSLGRQPPQSLAESKRCLAF